LYLPNKKAARAINPIAATPPTTPPTMGPTGVPEPPLLSLLLLSWLVGSLVLAAILVDEVSVVNEASVVDEIVVETMDEEEVVELSVVWPLQ
jgi:hypothetical protein